MNNFFFMDEVPQSDTTKVSPPPKSRRGLSRGQMFVFGIVSAIGVAILFTIGIAMAGVRSLSDDPFTLKTAKIFNLSVAKVNGQGIPYVVYKEDTQVLKKIYAEQAQDAAPFTDQDISDQVLSRLVINEIMRQLAEQYGVLVTQEDVKPVKAQLLAGYEDEAAAEAEIERQYGWNIKTFIDKVITPVLLEQKLAEAFSQSTDDAGKRYETEQVQARHILFQVKDDKDDAKVRKEAEAVLKRALQGEDFATLAGQFGSDGTKDQGGDLGWFGHGAMVPAFEQAAFALTPGTVSPELVKTEFGYHIIKVEGKQMVRDFNAFMIDQFTNANIRILLPIHNPFDDLRGQLLKSSLDAPAAGTDAEIQNESDTSSTK